MGVADRIDGPYNVDTVIGTIHMRIAEAISNLQENKDSITSKVGECAWACLSTHHVHCQSQVLFVLTLQLNWERGRVRESKCPPL